jgi:hypothetical protein
MISLEISPACVQLVLVTGTFAVTATRVEAPIPFLTR